MKIGCRSSISFGKSVIETVFQLNNRLQKQYFVWKTGCRSSISVENWLLVDIRLDRWTVENTHTETDAHTQTHIRTAISRRVMDFGILPTLPSCSLYSKTYFDILNDQALQNDVRVVMNNKLNCVLNAPKVTDLEPNNHNILSLLTQQQNTQYYQT